MAQNASMENINTLSERQKKILRAVVEEYAISAQPVGSDTLEKKYNLGFSPATLRNEMVKLSQVGFLNQPHTSAGRIPTAIGFRFYISELMDEKKLSVRDEVTMKEKLWDDRYEPQKLIREAARALADQTRVLGWVMTDNEDLCYSGMANILDMPEFFDIDVTKTVLSLLDHAESLSNLFNKAQGEDPIHILLGSELDYEFLEPCSFVFTSFSAGKNKSGTIGVIGPARLNYPSVIPTIRYLGDLLSEVTRNW